MIGFVLRVVALLAIYLLVLTSLEPGDILVGLLLSVVIVAGTRPRSPRPPSAWPEWLFALGGTLGSTALEVLRGTWRTVRFCLGGRVYPGFVEIPRADRTRRGVALWGILTGEAPDEYPVDVDEPKDVLVVHVLDARDPEGIRARHARVRERWQGRVVP